MDRGREIKEALNDIRRRLPQGVGLVAVSKFQPNEFIAEAYDAGQRRFGESRVQELAAKAEALPADIEWHFIGHLQTNKVRRLVGLTSLIESVDSPRLLELISAEALRKGVTADVLLQAHVAAEETKFGFFPEEMLTYLDTEPWLSLSGIRLRGIMGMASNTSDTLRVDADFDTLARLFATIRQRHGEALPHFDTLSMGMSGDWPQAVARGATLVRIGSAIFGERDYSR